MPEAIFIAVGWTLLAAGAAIAYWWGWRDPFSRIRRCPSCRYDMSATSGRRCPECGNEARNEKVMHRKRRRYLWVAAGLVIVLSSWFVFRWPEYLKNSRIIGPLAFVPRTMLVVGWPAIAKWQEASSNNPTAWWAKPDAHTHWNLPAAIEDKELWTWQRWMKMQVAAAEIQRTTTWAVLYSAAEMICGSEAPPEWAADAFMTRYADQSAERSRQGRWEERIRLRDIPERWKEPVAKAIAANAQILRHDPDVLSWLAADGRNMNDMADVVVQNKFPRDILIRLSWSFVQAKLDQPDLAALVKSFRSRAAVGRGTVMQLVARLDDRGSKYASDLVAAIGAADAHARMNACIAAAQFGNADPVVIEILRAAQRDNNEAVCVSAEIAEAVLLRDEDQLQEIVGGASAILLSERERDRRSWSVYVLYEYAEKGLLPKELAIRALHAAANGNGMDNWWHSAKSMSLLLELVDDSDPEVVAFVIARINEGGQIGNSAWYHFVKKGKAPKSIVDAARRVAVGMTGSLAAEREKQLREIEVQP